MPEVMEYLILCWTFCRPSTAFRSIIDLTYLKITAKVLVQDLWMSRFFDHVPCMFDGIHVWKFWWPNPFLGFVQEIGQRVGRNQATVIWICHLWMYEEMTDSDRFSPLRIIRYPLVLFNAVGMSVASFTLDWKLQVLALPMVRCTVDMDNGME
ncbi:hypothetical protein TNCV_605131 [Trichonephila clavipes]|nr:hypothetical protein TNCV_605131 [Trichonephila clavipes]